MNAFLLCLVIPILAGLALLARGWFLYRKSMERNNNWLETTGKILSSGVETHQGHESVAYLPVIFYQYRVNQTDYQSNVIRLSQGPFDSDSAAFAKRMVQKYPAGQSVTVYYNPEQPQQSALDTSVSSGGMWFYVVLGLGFIAAGLGFVYLMFISNP